MTLTDFTVLADQLDACDAVLPTSGPQISQLKVRIHGRGPVAEALAESLRGVGLQAIRSVRRPHHRGDGQRWPDTQLAILTDYHAHDPAIVNILMRQRIPHLSAHLRDGTGIVGPLVLPGLSSCLRCADHHRATMDPQWPMIAAQLLGKAGYASAATVHATVALAHEQVEQIAAGLSPSGRPDVAAPDLIDHTVEFHPHPVRLRRKRWPAHPSCGCRSTAQAHPPYLSPSGQPGELFF